MDESKDACNDVKLDSKQIKFLHRYADPPALDFVNAAIEKLKIANKMFRSFKLRLAIEEVAA